MTKIAIVVSHPIQHFVPQYSSWSRLSDVELKVFFASRHGLTPYHDINFARTVHWEGMKLDFAHEFLPGAELKALGPAIDSDALESRLYTYQPDILVVYGYAQRIQRRALAWAKKSKTPVCMIADSELRSRRNLFKRLFKRLTLPGIYNKVALFLTVGDANEAYYRHYGVHDHRLIRCCFPIDIMLYDTVLHDLQAARQRVYSKFGIPEHHQVILNVGKLVPWKRQRDLVLFSNTLQGKRDDITVILAGTGADETELRSLAQNEGPGGVVFAGFVMPNELTDYYCAADVYVHCAEHEPHSLAISEAIYCGRAVVISDRCGSYGPTDDVRHGYNGLVYRCGDIADLAQKLHFMLATNHLATIMGNRSLSLGQLQQKLAHGEGLKQAITLLKLTHLDR